MMRRRLVPELVQTSAMDCGPACLAALLRGHGIEASYGRLREACQTDVDGTSIDTLEEIACELGLEAQQVMVPVDHVLVPSYAAMPSIAVTRTPNGAPHFVVLWGWALGRIQIMDPARGRRWITPRALGDELYVHEVEVPATDWRDVAGTDELRAPLSARLSALGVADPERLIDRALLDPGWRPIAALDAATRMVAVVVGGGGIARGIDAERLVEALAAEAAVGADVIPDGYWYARAGSQPDVVTVRGAVLVQVTGVRAAAPTSPELIAALSEPRPRPFRALGEVIARGGALRPAAVAIGVVIAGAGVVAEAALFRGMFELGGELVTVPQLLGAIAAIAVFLMTMLFVDVGTHDEAARLGRNIELGLRTQLLAKLPRLGLHYLRSRPTSDMAERGHMLHRLRDLPQVAVRIVRATGEIAATTAGLIWVAPDAAPLALGLAASSIIPPLLGLRAIAERDLRLRTHTGALSRFYLDALVGTMPARAAGAERTLRREHEGLVAEWARAARAEHRVGLAVVVVQAVLATSTAIALVAWQARAGGAPATLLLLVYWSLAIPVSGQALAAALREIPTYRNLTARLLEPLGAIDEETAAVTRKPKTRDETDGPVAGIAIELADVSVVVGGRPVLRELDLAIAPGEHVAIIGASGSGKSTLVGLLLGWSRAAAGNVRVDGVELDGHALAALRSRTAWIDPAVSLWNRSLADNLAYGTPGADVAAAVAAAELEPVVAALPEGLATRLGEGGGLVSGGEGQRVRIGRGLARADARLVVLDEPFRGLDRAARGRQLALARARWAAATLLCVTHDIAETRAFPRVIVLDAGRIVEDGAPSELARRLDGRYAALLADEARAEAAWGRWRRLTLIDGRLEDQP